MLVLVSFMSHEATSHDWLLGRFVGRLSRHITVIHTHVTSLMTVSVCWWYRWSIPDSTIRNFVLVGLPAYLQRRLQSVLNAGARLVYRLRRYDHVTDALITLHWLRLPERVDFKVAVTAYRVVHGLAPPYLSQLARVDDLPSRRRLRSSSTHQLHVPPFRLSTVGRRSFARRRGHTLEHTAGGCRLPLHFRSSASV